MSDKTEETAAVTRQMREEQISHAAYGLWQEKGNSTVRILREWSEAEEELTG